jgi:hypothetical protein
MVERRHTHMSGNCAIARKLATRTWAVLRTGQPYQLRDLDGQLIDWATATKIASPSPCPATSAGELEPPPLDVLPMDLVDADNPQMS